MPIRSLQDLYLQELGKLYESEHQILRAMQEMANVAANPELKEALYRHMDQTRKQIRRLEKAFGRTAKRPQGMRSAGIEGIIAEGQEYLRDGLDSAVRDAGLISTVQRIEHYEMASYGSARSLAGWLGFQKAAELLQQTLIEETETDRVLTQIAETMVDGQATTHTPRYGAAYHSDEENES